MKWMIQRLNNDQGHDPTMNDDSGQDSGDNFLNETQIMNNIFRLREDLPIWRKSPILRIFPAVVGDRTWNISQTRLRCRASALNLDLYRVYLTASPFCQCGNMNEDAFHFLFECILYTKTVPRIKTCESGTFFYNGIKNWNELPRNIKEYTRKDVFKILVKQHLLDKGLSK